MPVTVTKENYDAEITSADKPLVIEVYSESCGVCKQMAPIFEELEKEHGSKYKFVKINVENSRDLAQQFEVTSIPTFIFMKDREVKGKESGRIAKDDLLAKIQDLLG